LDFFLFTLCSSGDSDEDSDAYIKPAKKTKPATQPPMTDFFEKKPAGSSKAAAKPASKTTTARKASGSTKSSQPPPTKAPVRARKAVVSSDDDELLLGEPESIAPVVPRAAAPRRVAAAKAKPAYIELSDDDEDD